MPSPKSAGFTLIEMLVVMAIMMILVGSGIAAFVNFNDRQIVLTSGKEVQGYLRAAQTKARAGETPTTGCDKFIAYGVRATQNTSQIRLVAVCSDGVTENEIPYATYSISEDVSFDTAVDIDFVGLHGGVTNPMTIEVSSNTRTFSFDVTATGEITPGELE
jgi:prepilin-type N-terminal cleavage/methylation domain-containing protein